MKLILASASPRRKAIFTDLGLDFEIVPSNADENTSEREPSRAVMALSRQKAENVFSRTGKTVVSADTIVVLDGQIMGKPKDEADARRMLRALSGRAHEVYTGICVKNAEKTVSRACRTTVRFRELSDTEIERYVRTGEPLDKAGAYGISGLGALLISGVEGDFWNVVGFPIATFGEVMREEFGMEIMPEK
ncbi:MAG: septum formation inhibitor Maf [Clostridia bacterium]|nr:septum formation inhibitor Maf [Clostridia bacterium]